jgi:hypothetical protein
MSSEVAVRRSRTSATKYPPLHHWLLTVARRPALDATNIVMLVKHWAEDTSATKVAI